jgi:hypothetical protein
MIKGKTNLALVAADFSVNRVPIPATDMVKFS